MLFRAPVYNNFSNLSRLPGLFGILLSTSTSKLVGCQVDQEISYFVSITEGHKKSSIVECLDKYLECVGFSFIRTYP